MLRDIAERMRQPASVDAFEFMLQFAARMRQAYDADAVSENGNGNDKGNGNGNGNGNGKSDGHIKSSASASASSSATASSSASASAPPSRWTPEEAALLATMDAVTRRKLVSAIPLLEYLGAFADTFVSIHSVWLDEADTEMYCFVCFPVCLFCAVKRHTIAPWEMKALLVTEHAFY